MLALLRSARRLSPTRVSAQIGRFKHGREMMRSRNETEKSRKEKLRKRTHGLCNKAYELRMICNVDVLLIMFDPIRDAYSEYSTLDFTKWPLVEDIASASRACT